MLPPTYFPSSPSSSPESPFVPDLSEGAEIGVYLALLELIDEGLIITGDEIILDANSAACRLLEREYRDIVGQPLAGLFTSERAFLEARARLLIQGEMRGSLKIALPGDRDRDVRFIAAARLRPGIHALILSPDFLADPNSTMHVQEDRVWARLAAVLAQPVIVVDDAGKIAAVNESALRRLGIPQKQLIGQSALACLGLEEAALGGSSTQLRLPGRDMVLSARVLRGPHESGRLLVLPTDALSAASGAESRVFDLFQYAGQAMLTCNGDRRVVSANPAFVNLLGYEPDEINGKMVDVFAAHHLPSILDATAWRQVSETGQWNGECWCQHKSGKVLPVWLSVAATQVSWKGVERYCLTLTDLTTQRWRESRARHFADLDGFDPPKLMPDWLTDFERTLPQAIENQQLEIHFQPLVDSRHEQVCGGEALLRWHHPQWGLIPFRRFIGAARDSGLIAHLGDWTLAAACRIAAGWTQAGERSFSLTVNVAVEQMIQHGFLERVERALSESGLPPERLELDLDERVLQEDPSWVIALLTDLNAMRIRLALDDFGCGPGMLLKLGNYPFKAIKLDPALVRDVGKDAHSEVVIEAIAQWAATFGLNVFARGVESKGQQAFLSALNCYLQQGPLFGPPLDAAAFASIFIDNQR